MDGEIVAVEQSTTHNSLDLIKTDEILRNENRQAELVVKQVLHNKPNPVMVRGKRHLEFEDWIALGNAYGITVKTRAEPVEIFEAKGFKGYATVIRVFDGVEIGGAEAYCLDNEENWLNKDYFQMASMAQTRAGSKALSNALRGVVALDKSLNGTPGEEMNGIDGEPKPNKPTSAPKPGRPSMNSSTMSNKAPAPKAPKPPKDDEAIEVTATEVVSEDLSGDKPSMSFKDLCDSNKCLNMVVKELQANEETVNRARIQDKLLDLLDMGKITSEEYTEAKNLLE